MLNLVKRNKKLNIEENKEKRLTPWDIMKEMVSLSNKKINKSFEVSLNNLLNKIDENELNLKYLLNHCLLVNSAVVCMDLEKIIFVSTFLNNKDYVKFLIYYFKNNNIKLPFYNIYYKLDLKRNLLDKEIINDMDQEDVDFCSELNKISNSLLKIIK